MKHVLYTLLLCALFQGCGSSKSVREKTDRRIMSDSLVEIKGNFERREGEIRTDSAGYIRQARQDRIVGAYLLLRMLCKRLPEIKALWKRIFKG